MRVRCKDCEFAEPYHRVYAPHIVDYLCVSPKKSRWDPIEGWVELEMSESCAPDHMNRNGDCPYYKVKEKDREERLKELKLKLKKIQGKY